MQSNSGFYCQCILRIKNMEKMGIVRILYLNRLRYCGLKTTTFKP